MLKSIRELNGTGNRMNLEVFCMKSNAGRRLLIKQTTVADVAHPTSPRSFSSFAHMSHHFQPPQNSSNLSRRANLGVSLLDLEAGLLI